MVGLFFIALRGIKKRGLQREEHDKYNTRLEGCQNSFAPGFPGPPLRLTGAII